MLLFKGGDFYDKGTEQEGNWSWQAGPDSFILNREKQGVQTQDESNSVGVSCWYLCSSKKGMIRASCHTGRTKGIIQTRYCGQSLREKDKVTAEPPP